MTPRKVAKALVIASEIAGRVKALEEAVVGLATTTSSAAAANALRATRYRIDELTSLLAESLDAGLAQRERARTKR